MLLTKKKPRPIASPPLLDLGGGRRFTLDDLRTHLLVLGCSGSGKSHSTEPILAALHRLGCPMLSTGIKPDEAARYQRICEPNRFVRVAPGSAFRINLFDYLYRLSGCVEGVAEFCRKLNECVLKSSSQQQQEAYWSNLFDGALLNSMRLVHLAFGELNIMTVYRTLSTAPKTRSEFQLPELLERPGFGEVLREAIKKRTDANEHDLQRAIDFFEDFSGIGDKGIGATLSMVNGTLGRLTSGDFYQHFATDTTLTPEIIERDRLCVLLDFPVLRHGPAGRLLNLAWTMLFQSYCLQRSYDPSRPPSILIRDEAQFSLNAEFDYQVATVARSQGLSLFSIIQDLDVLQASLGGDSRAEKEAFAFVSNHSAKLAFASANPRTGQVLSELIGEYRELFTSVSSTPGEADGFANQLLGVGRFSLSASEQMRPYLTASDLAALPRGVAVYHQAGRRFQGRPYLITDLRRTA